MMIIDLQARYESVNDAFCAIVGHPRETLVGMSRQSVTHPDDVAADTEALRSLLDGEVKTYTRDLRYIHAAGHPVWASIGVTLIRDPDGHPRHFIAQTQDITARRSYEGQLKHMADHDPLTGLLNRRSFERELNSHIARVKRSGMTGTVLMLDLDNFKYHNDTKGHSAGDALIVRIAHALRSRLRESDVIARLGGDEFAVLLPRETDDRAAVVARALLECVRVEAPASKLGERRRVTASIGIACFADALDTADDIMVKADLAMYDAKEHGRDRIATTAPTRTSARGSRARWTGPTRSQQRSPRIASSSSPSRSSPTAQRPDPVRADAAHARRAWRSDPTRHVPLRRRTPRTDLRDRSLGRRARDRHPLREP